MEAPRPKLSQTIARAVFSLLLGCALSVSATAATFDYSFYGLIDRAFLFVVPAFALAYLLFRLAPAAERLLEEGARVSLARYAFGLLFSLPLSYGAAGFLHEALEDARRAFFFAWIFLSAANVFCYFLIRRAARSLTGGFLRDPLNLLFVLALPALPAAALSVSLQFPSMLARQEILVPPAQLWGWALGAGAGAFTGWLALRRLDFESWKNARLFSFLSENLPGLYAGGVFFLFHLVVARALNRPPLGYNSVLFETDAGPWMNILASPQGDAVNRAVHPLSLLILRPLMRLPAAFFGERWDLAAMLVVAFFSASCVFMAYLFVKRATGAETYSFLFAALLGSSPAHLLFGSLTENYVFGATALIFFWLLVQAGERRLTRLVPAGVIVFGVTVTNAAQTVLALLFNQFGVRKTLRYCLFVGTTAVALTMLSEALYPRAQTFFFIPADLLFEGNFVKPAYDSPLASAKEKFIVAARTMFFYEIVAPQPLVVVSQKKSDPFPTIDLKTYDWRENKLASYKGWANLPLAAWLITLGGAFALFLKNGRNARHFSLALGLLGALGFNFLMHNIYGTELFLYTPYWAYALVFFTSLSYAQFAGKRRFEIFFAFFVLMVMSRNAQFIVEILRALAPFFAA